MNALAAQVLGIYICLTRGSGLKSSLGHARHLPIIANTPTIGIYLLVVIENHVGTLGSNREGLGK